MTVLKRRFFFVKPGIINTFKVKAYAAGATSAWSEPIDLKTSLYLPLSWGGLASLTAVARYWGRYIWLKWTPVTAHRIGYVQRFDHYMIFRKEGSLPTASELAISDDSNQYYYADSARLTVYRDYEIEPEKTYYYWIRAVDKKGVPSSNYLGPNNAEYGVPSTPVVSGCSTQVSEVWPSFCDVELRWTCTGGAEFYWVKRRLHGMSLWSFPIRIEHDASLGDNQSAVLNNFLVDTTYDFMVQAVNVVGLLKSDWSTDDGTPTGDPYTYTTGHDNEPPGQPRNFDADIPKNQNYVILRWAKPTTWLSDEIDGYEIYRRQDANPTGSTHKIASVGNVLFYKDDSVTKISGYQNHDYHYAVKAVDKYGYASDFSDFDSVSYDAPGYVSIAGSSITYDEVFNFWTIVKDYAVTFEWDDVLAADWYEVKWKWCRKTIGGSTYGSWTDWSAPMRVDEYQVSAGKAKAVVRVAGNGKIQFSIASYNSHGLTLGEVYTAETIIGTDKTAPAPCTGFSIRAYGNALAWLSNELEWDTHNWTIGVKCYRIQKQTTESDGTIKAWSDYWQVLPNKFGKKTRFIDWYPARLNAGITRISYRISAVDQADNEGVPIQLNANRPA